MPFNEKILFERIYIDDDRVRQESLDILPVPLDMLPVPAYLVDKHSLTLDPQMPPGEYRVVMSMIDSQTGERLSAYDEISEIWLPESEILLGNITIP